MQLCLNSRLSTFSKRRAEISARVPCSSKALPKRMPAMRYFSTLWLTCGCSGRLEPLDWESSINEICDLIVQTRSSASLLQIRGILYSLLSHSIPPAIIIKVCSSPSFPKKTPLTQILEINNGPFAIRKRQELCIQMHRGGSYLCKCGFFVCSLWPKSISFRRDALLAEASQFSI